MSNLKELLKEKNVSNEKAAELIGVSTRTITRWVKTGAPKYALIILENIELFSKDIK